MSNYMKFCSCRACKEGLHRKRGKSFAKKASRAFRYITKKSLKEGNVPPNKIGVLHTW